MSFHKASKKDEREFKEYTITAKSQETEPTAPAKTDAKGLQKALKEKGIDYSTFANADEHFRKRTLKDDYQDMKSKHGWLYDQPIE